MFNGLCDLEEAALTWIAWLMLVSGLLKRLFEPFASTYTLWSCRGHLDFQFESVKKYTSYNRKSNVINAG